MRLGRTWGLLLGLSLASTGLAAMVSQGRTGQAALGVILLLAWVKAHLILRDYLGLGRAPVILRGFDIALGLVMLAMLGLAMVA